MTFIHRRNKVTTFWSKNELLHPNIRRSHISAFLVSGSSLSYAVMLTNSLFRNNFISHGLDVIFEKCMFDLITVRFSACGFHRIPNSLVLWSFSRFSNLVFTCLTAKHKGVRFLMTIGICILYLMERTLKCNGQGTQRRNDWR